MLLILANTGNISCVIVDDESRAINRLKLLCNLIPEIDIIGEYSEPDECIDFIAKHNPNLLFLDVEMPVKTGIEVADELNKKYLDTKIVFTTSHQHYAIKAIKHKAFDYLLKPVGLDSIKEVIRRYTVEHLTELTKRELEIIALIAKGLKSKDIGEKLFLSRHTIDTYRRTILEKTGCKNSSELIGYATANNLI